ncbi:nuclease-related domain-containing protein [Nocardiopsis baichengensis]|uniref:nuclease-related domain-containing protein n=1 Tax=Nocardiopsis baichengensis TaxID=280240 RepID=UPI000347D1CB|nr:nuclease-related domain-containing protein [Nocardiopsis baichengensis]
MTATPRTPRKAHRAGASASAKARSIAAAERPRTLASAALAAAAGAALGAVLQGAALALVLAAAAATAAAVWRWRRSAAATWRMGAVGEKRTGRRLDPLARRGWTVLHDRRLGPGSRANVDHLLVAPDGTVVNVDSKVRNGAVRYDRRKRYLRIGKTSGFQLVKSTLYESEQIGQTLQRELGRPVKVESVLAVHRAKLPPWHNIEIKGVKVMSARDVRSWLRSRGGRGTIGGKEVAAAAEKLFHPYQ